MLAKMESTKIEMVKNDEDIETISEREDLLTQGKKVVKSKSVKASCCKALLIATAVSIFIAMLVNIWNDYGSYIETHSLPPSIHSMSSHCPESLSDTCMTKSYNSPTCTFSNRTQGQKIVCDTSKPNHHSVQLNFPHLVENMSWTDHLEINFTQQLPRCLHMTIWSV